MRHQWIFDRAKLITLREFKDLTRRECAAAISKTEQAYGLKERGRTDFTVSEICALSNCFGVDPRAFFIRKPTEETKVA